MNRERALYREYLEALLIAVIFATFARTYVVQAFKIPTGSMEENLLVGDHILVNKFIYGSTGSALEEATLPQREIRRGDIVVFKFPQDPTRDFIKRCVGLPGDTVEISAKQLIVNGETIEEAAYIYHTDDQVYPDSRFLLEQYRKRDNFGPFVIPGSHYFCLGDNRDNSNDSRFWGPVPADYVKGRAFIIYWSFAGPSQTVEWPGFQGKLRQLSQVGLNFFSATRWERTFRVVR